MWAVWPRRKTAGSGLSAVSQNPNLPAVLYDRPRRWTRYPFEMETRIVSQPRRESLLGRSIDISEGGVAVRLDHDLDVGAPVEIEVAPPFFQHVLRLPAVVRNRAGNRYGLEYKQPPRKEQAWLARLCNALMLVQRMADVEVTTKSKW